MSIKSKFPNITVEFATIFQSESSPVLNTSSAGDVCRANQRLRHSRYVTSILANGARSPFLTKNCIWYTYVCMYWVFIRHLLVSIFMFVLSGSSSLKRGETALEYTYCTVDGLIQATSKCSFISNNLTA